MLMRFTFRTAIWFPVLSLVVASAHWFAAPAAAQNDAYLTAERLAARARLAMVADDPQTAGKFFEQAHDTLADPSYLIHAAEAYVSGGLWTEARRVYTIMLNSPTSVAERDTAERGITMCAATTDTARALVSVYIQPENASIWLDSEQVTANPPDLWMTQGQHELRFEHPGHEPKRLVVDAVVGRPTLVRVRLAPKETLDSENVRSVTRLKITANVANADVFIDGRKVGTTPVADMEVATGLYEIRIVKEGFSGWQRSVSVGGPFPTEVLARLEPIGGQLAPRVSSIAVKPPKPEEVTPAELANAQSTDETEPIVPTPYRLTPDDDPGSDLVTYGWTVFGVGAAAALAGGVFQILAITSANEANDLSSPAADSDPDAAIAYYNSVYVPEHNRLQDQAESRQTIAMALAIGGGAVAAAGLITALIGHSDNAESTAEFGVPVPDTEPPIRMSTRVKTRQGDTMFQIGPTDGGVSAFAWFRF